VLVDSDGRFGTEPFEGADPGGFSPQPAPRQAPKSAAKQAMLNREVEKLQVTVALQQKQAAQQQKEIEALTARLKEQAAQIQKVSAQLEARKPAPQVVNNP
jgi:hypothetical protein